MTVDVVIEIPQGSQNKYEVDHGTGRVRLDRVLFSPMHYPTEYGFIEGTLGEDGDPLDILVLATFPTFPGCIMRGRIVGMLEMIDNKEVDHKLLAVAADDPRFKHVETMDDVPEHTLKEIAHFFETYKELQGVHTDIGAWKNEEEALKVLKASEERNKKSAH